MTGTPQRSGLTKGGQDVHRPLVWAFQHVRAGDLKRMSQLLSMLLPEYASFLKSPRDCDEATMY